MQVLSLNQFALEDIKEMSLIEVAFEILKEKKQAVSFQDLVKEIANVQQISAEKIQHKISQFYTDLNVDGRFSTTGENRWGLKEWYPIEQVEDEMTNPVKPKKKKAKKVVLDEFEDLDEDLDEFEEDVVDDDILLVEEDDDLLDEDEEDLDELLEDEFEIDDLDEEELDEDEEDKDNL
mgnify:FL=1